jgi:hypothetical protein
MGELVKELFIYKEAEETVEVTKDDLKDLNKFTNTPTQKGPNEENPNKFLEDMPAIESSYITASNHSPSKLRDNSIQLNAQNS